MNIRIFTPFLFLLLLTACIGFPTNSLEVCERNLIEYYNDPGVITTKTGQISIVFRESLSEKECLDFLLKYNLNTSTCFGNSGSGRIIGAIDVPVGSEIRWSCILQSDPRIKAVEPNFLMRGREG